MNYLYYLFLINYYITIFSKINNWFCKYTCTRKNYNEQYLNFKIKNKFIKTKIIKKEDLCIKQCENNYIQIRKLYEEEDKENYNFCINNNKNKIESDKEYLKNFAKGSCNPLIILPGIFGSKLEFIISNCKDFKKNYKDINKICKFDCKNKIIYNLWVPDSDSSFFLFTLNNDNAKCFGELMKIIYIKNEKTNEFKFYLKKGLNVRVKGLTKDNGKNSKCGVDSTENLSEFFINNYIKEAYGFKFFTNFLLNKGYKIGLTIQYLPYDFRLSYKDNDLNDLFKENVERLNRLTKKKVIIISHSLGSLNALYQIRRNEKEELYKKIGNFISVTPPFFGSNKVIFNILNLFSKFYIKQFIFKVGINRKINEKIIESNLSLYELIPPNPIKFINEKWFNWVKNRINHEISKNEETYNIDGANLLPNVNEICYNESNNKKCEYELQNYFKPVIKFSNNKFIKLDNFRTLINNYTKNEKIKKFVESSSNDNLFEYNPKIQQTFIFINSIDTLESIEYTHDITNNLLEGTEYIKPDIKYKRRGDQSISSFSVLYKAFKQAYEFKNEKNKGYKPVKILEFCSKNKKLDSNKKNYYDKYDDNLKQNVFIENSYNGIDCSCDSDLEKKDCTHSRIFLDKKFHKSIFKLIQLNEKVENYDKFIENISEKELKSYSEECIQLRNTKFRYKNN